MERHLFLVFFIEGLLVNEGVWVFFIGELVFIIGEMVQIQPSISEDRALPMEWGWICKASRMSWDRAAG